MNLKTIKLNKKETLIIYYEGNTNVSFYCLWNSDWKQCRKKMFKKKNPRGVSRSIAIAMHRSSK